MHKITVKITAEGKTEIAVDGVTGRSCKDITKAIEAALGRVEADTTKPEFHLTVPAAQRIAQKGS